MPKTLLITGATDGIGLATARALAADGHTLLIHGRTPAKLAAVAKEVEALPGAGSVATFEADLSDLDATAAMARAVTAARGRVDVLINNAGVFKTDTPTTPAGEDRRFLVNTFAPALLSRLLLPVIPADGRLIHLSSAAQAPVDLEALAGGKPLDAMAAYAQSKLAISLWSAGLAAERGAGEPVTVAVNPGSLLATNMVRTGFGVAGSDINIGVDILTRAALSDEFAAASGRYYDNDSARFAPLHGGGRGQEAVFAAIEARIAPHMEPANA